MIFIVLLYCVYISILHSVNIHFALFMLCFMDYLLVYIVGQCFKLLVGLSRFNVLCVFILLCKMAWPLVNK